MAARQNRAQDLAVQVLELAKREGLASGDRLREQWLADRLEVSRSPVRAALQVLADKNLAVYEPMRGYFLAENDPGSLAELQQERPSAEEELYETLATARFTKVISERIEVSDLIRRFSVSRALANRVLARMSGEGILEPAPGRGWRFIPTLATPEAYEESYRFRLLLEPAMLLEEGFRLKPAVISELRRSQERLLNGAVYDLPKGALFDSDALFHEGLASCCGNQFIEQSVRQQTRMRRISDYQMYAERDRIAEFAREHLAILDALEAGKQETAAELMRDHITISERVRPDFS